MPLTGGQTGSAGGLGGRDGLGSSVHGRHSGNGGDDRMRRNLGGISRILSRGSAGSAGGSDWCQSAASGRHGAVHTSSELALERSALLTYTRLRNPAARSSTHSSSSSEGCRTRWRCCHCIPGAAGPAQRRIFGATERTLPAGRRPGLGRRAGGHVTVAVARGPIRAQRLN